MNSEKEFLNNFSSPKEDQVVVKTEPIDIDFIKEEKIDADFFVLPGIVQPFKPEKGSIKEEPFENEVHNSLSSSNV